MYKYPLIFTNHAEAGPGVQENWASSSHEDEEQPVMLAIPPEFNGPGGALSPEGLYGMALTNCFIATFKVIAEASQFDFEKIEANMELVVDKDETGKPWVAKAHLKAQLTGNPNKDKAMRLMEKASQNCLIINSVKTEKTYEFQVLS